MTVGFMISFHIARADFWDPGLSQAAVKTAYATLNEGTPSNPITVSHPFPTNGSCLWDQNDPELIIVASNGSGCPSGPTTYGSTSFAWWQNTSWFSNRFWVLELNNEPSWNPLNPGPPDLSLPRSAPGSGLMGFSMVKDTPASENFWRAHLVSNGFFSAPFQGSIPFMAVGASTYRGNGEIVTHLSFSPVRYKQRVKFTAKLWDYAPFKDHSGPGTIRGAAFQMYAIAKWGGKPRLLFILLFHHNLESDGGLSAVWNWPITESLLSPGSDVAFLDAEDMQSLCGFSVPRLTTIGQQIDYDINLLRAFQCASNLGLFRDPMPISQAIPVTNISWGNEWFGKNGALWTSAHNMHLQ